MACNQKEVNNVYENLFTRLWRESCGDYLNFGMFDDTCKTLIEANDNMVDWIIEKLNIDNKSTVLDIGCGRGKYTVEIAKKTDCKFVGVDIVEKFITCANTLRDESNLSENGQFLVGDMLKLSEAVKDRRFTHVLALGSLFYVHDKMAPFLENVKPHMEANSLLLIHDFSRNVPLEEVKVVMNHWRTTADTLETQNYLDIIKSAGFDNIYHSDDTAMGLKSCQWVVDVTEKIAPSDADGKSTFTFWVLRDALKARRILHNTIIARNV